jgi:hypothetical protein
MKSEIVILYRSRFNGVPPRPIKLLVPGWAGEKVPRGDGSVPQPWHCKPFVDGATYGLELVYPFSSECRVRMRRNRLIVDADFSEEPDWMLDTNGKPEVPFSAFATGHYGMTTCLDVQPPSGFVLRIEPHPRVFSGESSDAPLAIPGHIERFWPRILFVVFKAPPPRQVHVFRKGEPYAQLLVVPQKVRYAVEKMSRSQEKCRARQDKSIAQTAELLSTGWWESAFGGYFDDKYKQLGRFCSIRGEEATAKRIDDAQKELRRRHKSRIGRSPT